MIEIREYIDARGRNSFQRWVDRLDPIAVVRVRAAIDRMEAGNLSNAKGVGRGVFEYRMDFGPGYRIYFGRDGDTVIILLGGGTKAVSTGILRTPGRFGKSTDAASRQEA